MSTAELTALLLFCTAMSFSPGPNTTLSTALAANLGLKRALRFCLAVPTGWTLLMLGSGLGLGALDHRRSRAALDGHADGRGLHAVAGLEARPAPGSLPRWTAAACR